MFSFLSIKRYQKSLRWGTRFVLAVSIFCAGAVIDFDTGQDTLTQNSDM